MVEALVATSVIVAGILVAYGRAAHKPGWLVLIAVAGLFHGYAFAEAVLGGERVVIGAYLVGIAIIASTIATGIMLFTRHFIEPMPVAAIRYRTAGIMLGCVGAVMLAGSLVGG